MPEKLAGDVAAPPGGAEAASGTGWRPAAWTLAFAAVAGLLVAAFPVLLSPLPAVDPTALHTAIAVVSFGLALATLLAAWKPVDDRLRPDMLALVAGFAAASTAGLALVMLAGVIPPHPGYGDALHHLMGFGSAAGLLGASFLLERKAATHRAGLQALAAASGCGLALIAIASAYRGAFPATAAGLYAISALSTAANLWALWRILAIRHRGHRFDIQTLMLAACAGAVADLFMGLHIGDDGTRHVIGCLFRIGAFFLAYRAVRQRAFTGPFAELMREMRGSSIADARIQRLLDLSSDWYWEQDSQFRFTRLLTGHATDVNIAIGRTRWDAPSIGVSDQEWAEHRATLEARKPFRDFIVGRIRPDGSRRWFSVSGEPVFDAGGRFSGYRGIGKDITALKQAEDAARASEARVKALLEMSVDWYWEQDEQFRFTRMEGASAPANALPDSSPIGKTRWEMPILNMSEADWAPHKSELQAHRPFRNMVQQLGMPDGRIRTVRVSGDPVFDQEGRFAGYRGVGTDISETQAALDALKAVEARQRAMLDLSVDWYWEQDDQFRFTRIEGQAAPFSTETSRASIGKTRWELVAGGDAEELWQRHRATVEAHRPFRGFTYKLAGAEGRTHWVSISGEPFFDASGRFAGYRGVGTDISNLIMATEALRESEARFRALVGLSSDWYWELDQDLRYQSLSASAPIAAATSIGRRQWELPWTGKNESDWARHRGDLEAHRAFRDFELSIVDGAGGLRWMRLDGEPVFDPGGEFRGYRGVGRDVTEKRIAEQALRESKERLDLALNGSQLTLSDWDLPSGRVYLSEQWPLLLEQPDAGPYARIEELQALVHPEDLTHARAVLVGALKGTLPNYSIEYRIRTGSGRWKWITSRGTVTRRDADGRAQRLTGINADIDSRKQTEARISTMLREQQALFAASPVGVFTANAARVITMANGTLERMFGYAKGEMLGLPTRSLCASEDVWLRIGEDGYSRIDRDGVMRGEIQYRRKDGSLFWGLLQGVMIDAQDPGKGRMFTAVDISDSKRAEQELRASQHMLSLIADNVPAMIAYFDASLHCQFANPPFCRAFGIAREEITGLHLHEILGARAYADVVGFFGQVLAHSDVEFEYRFALPDGKSRYFRASLVPDIDANGSISGCYALFGDITDYKTAEEQIRRLNIELEQRVQDRTRQLIAANKELEAFSYSVSHDLQAPLRRIERYAELLTETGSSRLDAPGRDMLDRIRDATGQTRQLIADVMKLAKISRTDLSRSRVDVSAMARTVLDEIAAASVPQREVRVSIEPGIGADADPALLRILLDNLLGNAWKFTASAVSPTIEVGALGEARGPGFFVRDNGAGFDMRFAYKLFGAFQRLHAQSEFKGTGIGLAMVQRIVNLHGWNIGAEGEPGKGAIFRVKTT